MPDIKTHEIHDPSALYDDPESPLYGFDVTAVSGPDYDTPQAKALYDALGTGLDDEEMILGALPNGKWALVGLAVQGHIFAVGPAGA